MMYQKDKTAGSLDYLLNIIYIYKTSLKHFSIFFGMAIYKQQNGWLYDTKPKAPEPADSYSGIVYSHPQKNNVSRRL